MELNLKPKPTASTGRGFNLQRERTHDSLQGIKLPGERDGVMMPHASGITFSRVLSVHMCERYSRGRRACGFGSKRQEEREREKSITSLEQSLHPPHPLIIMARK